MGNDINKAGGSPINRLTVLAEAATPGRSRKIADEKKEAQKLTSDLVYIRDKAHSIPVTHAVKSGKKRSKVNRQAKLIENIADLALAPQGREFNDCEQIGADEAALTVITSLEDQPGEEMKALRNAAGDLAHTSDAFPEKESDGVLSTLAPVTEPGMLGMLGKKPRLDRKFRQGLSAKLLGSVDPQTEKNAQRKQAREKVGLEAVGLIAEAEDNPDLKMILGLKAAPHDALKAIEINGNPGAVRAFPFFGFGIGKAMVSDAREDMKALSLFYKGKEAQGTPAEARQAKIIGNIIQHSLATVSHDDMETELAEYRGALWVIGRYREASGTSKSQIVASCAEKVLTEAMARQDRSGMDINEMKGGVSALKVLAQELDCRTAQRALASDKANNYDKLKLLAKLSK